MAGTYAKKPWSDGVSSLTALELDGIVATVGTPSVTIKEVDASGDVTYCVGATVPTNGDAGYAVGCFFKLTSGNGPGTTLYVNEGTSASAAFNAIGTSGGEGAQTITSTSANALAVGPNGTTNPTFDVDASTASAAAGLKIKGAAAGSGVAVTVVSSGTNESATVDAKGSGSLTLNGTATGPIYLTPNSLTVNKSGAYTVIDGGSNSVQLTAATTSLIGTSSLTIQQNTTPPAGGSSVAALKMSNTANFGIYFGSGAPTVSAAQGSLYIRTDGSSTSTRMYVNTNGSTTWTNVTTAA